MATSCFGDMFSSGTETRYNPSTFDISMNSKKAPRIGLIHELKHAYDRDRGVIKNYFSKEFEYYDSKTKTSLKGKVLEDSEVDALNVENAVRYYIRRRTGFTNENVFRNMYVNVKVGRKQGLDESWK